MKPARKQGLTDIVPDTFGFTSIDSFRLEWLSDAHLTADQEVTVFIPTRSGNILL